MKKILFTIAATMLLVKSAAAVDARDVTWCCGNHPQLVDYTCDEMQKKLDFYKKIHPGQDLPTLSANIKLCNEGVKFKKITWTTESNVGCGNYDGRDCGGDQPYKVIETSQGCPFAVKDLGNKTYQIDHCNAGNYARVD